MNKDILQIAANQARGLAIDAVHACHSGHVGLPLGSAEIGAVLYGHALSVNPDEPRWLNRDRFILSGGHGSMFLYSWLHLAGFDLDLEEIKFPPASARLQGIRNLRKPQGLKAQRAPWDRELATRLDLPYPRKWRQQNSTQTPIPYWTITLWPWRAMVAFRRGCPRGVCARGASAPR